MNTVSLSGSLRENVGKKDARKHRRDGNVPCVLYGGKEQIHFIIPERDLTQVIFTPNSYLIALNVDGKEYMAIMQDIQYHPVTDIILHIDFLQIFDDKPLIISVPLRYEGSSKGVLQGGRLVRKYRKLKIKGLINDIPDEIVVNITELAIGDGIKISELKYDDIEFLDKPSSIAVAVKTQRVIVEEEEEEKAEGEGDAAEGDAKDGESPKEGEGKKE
ncbi:MAG: 50S ribosomal protein L25/general stress protein Ctc [Bacteroidetes bacterium 4484_276]|nr:MAG: 50S ribosomal protein L25/general stress protein Ctc [Bacteroidetes bacterium 4484_276]OYT12959.1 MAG: 50S ribosomal protein L25/general stress protein Ctc [Bacteroidetes bacterium 4572_114]